MAGIILTGVDNSETALKAAEKAAALAVALDAELHVATAFNVNTTGALQSVRKQGGPEAMSRAYSRLLAQHTEEAERTASGVAGELRRIYPKLKIVAKAIEGKPGIALSNDADEIDAALIVVGNKRVQGATRVFGSVARTVASETGCDLYVVNTNQR